MDYGKLTLEELKKGYHLDKEQNAFICNSCHAAYPLDQVFPIGDKYYAAEPAVTRHIEIKHNSSFEQLLNADTKYNTLTPTQKELLMLFYAGTPDSETAKKLQISPSTVRRQKFNFREKAKSAKLYLAIYDQVFRDKSKKEEVIPIHNHAIYVDDRYLITEEEKQHILDTSFESMQPLKLKSFSSKEKKKVVILGKIAELFEYGKQYKEAEINQILKNVYEDFISIRRYLIMYGFMERTPDGSRYWLTD